MVRWIGFAFMVALLVVGCQSNGNEQHAVQTPGEPPTLPVTQEGQPETLPTKPEAGSEVLADKAEKAEPGAEPKGGPTDEVVFAEFAFPPTVPDTDWHRNAWWVNDCLRCHETGVQEAPEVVHEGMPEILLEAKCRTCHVLIPGSMPRPRIKEGDLFIPNAFPPMIPASESHKNAWTVDDCLLCHETGVHHAPIVRHEGMPARLLEAKCRTCHVQVRSVAASEQWK